MRQVTAICPLAAQPGPGSPANWTAIRSDANEPHEERLQGPGFEYWSRRPAKGCVDPGKENKAVTHRLERAAAKRKLNEENR